MKKLKAVLSIFLVIIIALGGSGCMEEKIIHSDVTNYLETKYNDTFYVDETISPGIDVKYYHCHSSQHSDKQFVVYKENGKYKDNYFGILIHQQYLNILNSILSNYFDDFKVYFRFINNFFDDDIVEINELSKYLRECPEQFFVDIFIYTSEENAEEINIDSLTNELKDEFVNYYISLNLVDEETLKIIEEDTYLSVECDNYYTNVVK